MSRYIDADKIVITAERGISDGGLIFIPMIDVHRNIDATPTADVVESVRCKDCKFWGIPHINDTDKSHYCCRDNMWCMPLRFANDYCSYGERKDDGT